LSIFGVIVTGIYKFWVVLTEYDLIRYAQYISDAFDTLMSNCLVMSCHFAVVAWRRMAVRIG